MPDPNSTEIRTKFIQRKNFGPVKIVTYNGEQAPISEVMKEIMNNPNNSISVEDFITISFPIDDKKRPEWVFANHDSIYMNYSDQERWDMRDTYFNNPQDLYVKTGTLLVIPTNNVKLDLIPSSKRNMFLKQSSKGKEPFWSENYKKLITDKEYIPIDEQGVFGTNCQVLSPNIRVWAYSSVYATLIDISGFVDSCATQKSLSEGSFVIRLLPYDESWEDIKTHGYGDFYETMSVLDKDGNLQDSSFKKLFGFNDLVFIRFEALQLEKDPNNLSAYKIRIPLSKLANTDSQNYKVWDMIGLIDSVTQSYDAEANDLNVTIQGRDFTKLFTDDGSYFIPLKYIEGSKNQWMYGGDQSSNWFGRNVITGAFDVYMSYSFRDITSTLHFFLNQLSNLAIVEDPEVFKSYGKRLTKLFEVNTSDPNYKNNKNVRGVWQIVHTFIEERLRDRTIVNYSLANPEGTMMGLFEKVCQSPFVEFFGDTYVDTFDLVVRQPPFTRKDMESIIKDKLYISIATKDLLKYSLSYDTRSYSWYQIHPQNSFFGETEFTSLAYVPIIYFTEIAEWRGNQRMVIDDIYIPLDSIGGESGNLNLNIMANSLLNDLLFLIETTIHLPFTRTGTIVLNGDRRIKVGSFVYIESFKEIFYVTGVEHSINFEIDGQDRTTTIQVERGMKKDLIEGIKTVPTYSPTTGELQNVGEKLSYFDLVDIEKMRSALMSVNDPGRKLPTNADFKLNPTVFNYLKGLL